MKNISPIFHTVSDPMAAEALSEPFVKPGDFQVEWSANSQTGLLTPDNVVAVGTAYVVPDGKPGFEYAMHPLVKAPLVAAQRFVEGYETAVTPKHAQAERFNASLGRDGMESWMTTVIEYVNKAGLRTIGTFALFSVGEKQRYESALIVPSVVVDEVPLAGRDDRLAQEQANPVGAALEDRQVAANTGRSVDEIERGYRCIKHNKGQKPFGVFTATLHMPRIQALKKIIDGHTEVNGFIGMTRKDKRILLREEQKKLRKAQS